MKFTKMTGMALAGALLIGSAAPALAQSRPFDPYYITPKISYSHTMLEDYTTDTKMTGVFGPTKKFYGKDTSDGTFGGGLAIGYDFGAYTEYPIRVELEYMHRGNVNAKSNSSQVSNSGGYSMNRLPVLDGDANNGMNAWPVLMHNYGLSSLAADAKLTAKIQTVMVNFYLDFPTDTAFTPYVQAGVGGAYVDAKSTVNVHGVTSVTDANGGWWTDRPDGAGDIDGYDGIGTYAGGFNQRYTGQQNSWNLAWNVGAGFAYQLKDNIALDLSYRYSYFGEAEFGTRGYNVLANGQRNPAYDVATGATWGDLGEQIIGRTSSKSSVKLDAHEVIVGLRFTGW